MPVTPIASPPARLAPSTSPEIALRWHSARFRIARPRPLELIGQVVHRFDGPAVPSPSTSDGDHDVLRVRRSPPTPPKHARDLATEHLLRRATIGFRNRDGRTEDPCLRPQRVGCERRVVEDKQRGIASEQAEANKGVLASLLDNGLTQRLRPVPATRPRGPRHSMPEPTHPRFVLA